MQSAIPPGCEVLESLKYSRRRRTRCAFSAVFTAMNQMENARVSSVAAAGDRPSVRALRSARALRIALAAPDRLEPIALDQLEEFLAALVAKRLADQVAERMHILAQRCVFDAEIGCFGDT